MMMNRRHQHAVGQGFFHTAELYENGELLLRYVYDCGAMKTYSRARDDRIDDYVRAAGVGGLIDILFLSHAHYDHVSGVERLLASGTGLNVDTIVLPLLNVADRLIAYARASAEEPGLVRDDFYRAFILEPAAALSRFGPRQILFVRRGAPRGGAPGSRGPDDPYEAWQTPEVFGQRRERGPSWKLTGSGRGDQFPSDGASREVALSVEPVTIIDDTLAFAILSNPTAGAESASSVREWLLAPFVDPTVNAKRRKFIKALAHAKSMTVRSLEKWLEQVSNVQDLVVNGVRDLATAYRAIEPDFNVTSLCLYSGPRPTAPAPPKDYQARFGGWSTTAVRTDRIAWLATGDAALALRTRSAAFSRHYGHLLSEVVTLTLPHHGSDKNLDPKLLKGIGAQLFVAPADRFAKWRHPGSRTVQVVAGLGHFVSTVTSAPASEVTEAAEIS